MLLTVTVIQCGFLDHKQVRVSYVSYGSNYRPHGLHTMYLTKVLALFIRTKRSMMTNLTKTAWQWLALLILTH